MKINSINNYNQSFSAKLNLNGRVESLSKEEINVLVQKAKEIGKDSDVIHVGIEKFHSTKTGRPITVINRVKDSIISGIQRNIDAPYRNNSYLLERPFDIINEYIDMIAMSLKNPQKALQQFNNKKEYYNLADEIDNYYSANSYKSLDEFKNGLAQCEAEKRLNKLLGKV